MLLLVSAALAGWLSPRDVEVSLLSAQLPATNPAQVGWEVDDAPARAARDATAVFGTLVGDPVGTLVTAVVAGSAAAYAAPDPRGTLEGFGPAAGAVVEVPLREDTHAPTWDPPPMLVLTPRRGAGVLLTLWDDDLDDDDLLGTARVEAPALRRAARGETPLELPLVDLAGRPVGTVSLRARRAG